MGSVENERRYIEFKALENTDKMIIEGYAIVFDTPATHKIGEYKFTEVIKREALDFTDFSNVPLRYNHNDSWIVIASTRNDSLKLVKDEVGLKIRAELIDTQSNKDIFKSIQCGLIDKMSFAFTVSGNGDTWIYEDDYAYRTVTDINKLYDVSVVDTPFYDTTSIYARSIELLEGLDLHKRKLKMKYKV